MIRNLVSVWKFILDICRRCSRFVLGFWRWCSHRVPFKWSALKGVMSSKFARLTVIIPIIGWLLIYNDNLIQLFEELLGEELPEELNWKVYIFYVGLFCISVSSILYAIFCPKEISAHTSDVNYVKSYRLLFTEKFEKSLSQELGSKAFMWGDPAEEYRNKKTKKFSLVRRHEANEEDIIDTLLNNYDRKNASWPIIRIIALLVFCLGVVLASVPTLSTVHWASCLVVKDTEGYLFIDKIKNTCAADSYSSENHLEDMQQAIFSYFSIQ